MRVSVIIPVGPYHREIAEGARQSVMEAWANPGPFRSLNIDLCYDHAGGNRSRARNEGLSKPCDWYFLLDADDRMMREAFSLVDLSAPATFGQIMLDGKRSKRNRHPVTRADLFEHGADGTLTMGFFLRGDLGLRFDETLENGEDFDFYMRLPGFVKVKPPLVNIGYSTISGNGKHKGFEGGWHEACRKVIDSYA